MEIDIKSDLAPTDNPGFRLALTDPFGHILILKRLLMVVIGILTYPRINILNRIKIEGLDHLKALPRENVLFVSNHQSYYADVITFFHIFSAASWGMRSIRWPFYLLYPRVRSYYVAAEETMKEGGLFPKILAYAGAVTVKRSWRHKGENVNRSSDFRAPKKLKKALSDGWLINFPQGTTAPGAPIRKGASSIIKATKPVVVPVKIRGFDKAFGKKGFFFRKAGNTIKVSFGEPVQFHNTTAEQIHEYLEEQILD